MLSMSQRTAAPSPAVALLAALAFSTTVAQAQVTKPFKIKGGGIATTGLPFPWQPPREHTSVGEATHLGRYHGDGMVQTDTLPDLTIGAPGEFGGGSPYVFVGANGENLVTWYGRTDHGATQPGSYTIDVLAALPDGTLIVEAFFIAEFVAQPDQSTGKFAGVTGSWIMYAQTAPFVLGASDPVPYTWEGEGTLTFLR
jgi:hypothetical protein